MSMNDRTMEATAAASVPIVMDGIGKTYRTGLQAVKEFSLTLERGEFVTIVGPSGCGKSTVLRIVAGLGEPTTGTVEVFGMEPHEARRVPGNVGYVFQDPTLMPWRTVLDNVGLPLELKGTAGQERKARSRNVLELVGLQDVFAAYPRQLSGGMRMRVSIARALISNPALLLMDEPFGALDEITRQRLNLELLRIFQETELSVCFVTHNVFEAVFLSSRVVVMSPRPGRIAGEVKIDASYPRDARFRTSATFTSAAGEIMDLLDH